MTDDKADELIAALKRLTGTIAGSSFWIGIMLYFIMLSSCSRH